MCEAELGLTGRQWVCECLQASRYAGRLLLRWLDLEEGRVIVVGSRGAVPPHDDLEQLRESIAHLGIIDRRESEASLVTLLASLGRECEQATSLVAENDVLLPGDPRAQELVTTGDAVIAHGTVFHVAEPGAGSSEVLSVLARPFGYPLNAYVVRGSGGSFIEWLENEDGQTFAAHLVATVHTIYDGEGYAVWTRAPSVCVIS